MLTAAGLFVLLILVDSAGFQVDELDEAETEPEIFGVMDLRELHYLAYSPDQTKKIIVYQLSARSESYTDYREFHLSQQKIIAVQDVATEREEYLFIGEDRTGNPKWLGNNHVFFTAYCGTACQGLYLLDTRNQESRTAVISYLLTETGSWQTHFRDWFDQKFIFRGLIGEMTSEIVNEQVYLVFDIIDGQGSSLGRKQFRFTGTALEE